jgi:hypothetical protein
MKSKVWRQISTPKMEDKLHAQIDANDPFGKTLFHSFIGLQLSTQVKGCAHGQLL